MATAADNSTVTKQIEFYFSDSNYRRDSFLRAAAENDPEGFVPISTLLTFNKLKTLTTSEEEVAKAAEASTSVVLSDDRKSIRRAVPMPEEDLSKQRTVYVKGFEPTDADATIDGIQAFFSRYGGILFVRLRKDPETKQFKGSCFIEFEDREKAEACVADASNVTWKEKPFDCIMHLAQWLDNRHEKRKTTKRKAGSSSESKAESKAAEESKWTYVPGLIVRIENVPSSSTRELLQEKFQSHGEIKYIEFCTGDTEGFLRFSDPAAAEATAKILQEEGGVKLNEGDDTGVTGYRLEGDGEKEYWEKIWEKSKEKRSRGSKSKKRQRRH